MNALEQTLRAVARLLAVRNQAWALVGGLAVSVRTEPRFTRDIDLARDDLARPQDAADLRRLFEAADQDDFGRALEACRLIEQRRFHRSRDLVGALTEMRESCRT